MIVRKEANGSLVLVGQTDHSRLVGQFAAHWGNERFAAPEPYDSVMRAAVYHDYGWLRYETSPIVNDETGETPDFRQVGGRQLDSYQWCVDWMTGIDRYSGLIVSMHRTGLWKSRYGTIAYPHRLQHPRSARARDRGLHRPPRGLAGAEQQRTLDPAQVWTNYRLLQVWDLLGLYFCCAEPGEDRIEPVPAAYGAGKTDGVRLDHERRRRRARVAFDPYPFDARGAHVQLSGQAPAGAANSPTWPSSAAPISRRRPSSSISNWWDERRPSGALSRSARASGRARGARACCAPSTGRSTRMPSCIRWCAGSSSAAWPRPSARRSSSPTSSTARGRKYDMPGRGRRHRRQPRDLQRSAWARRSRRSRRNGTTPSPIRSRRASSTRRRARRW